MSKTATVLTWTAVILLAAVYISPLWVIHLVAAQYPQGLGLHIWVDKITGAQPHDLQNINGLNHYIGMRKIEPEVIPELRYMKYIVAALMMMGAVAGILRRRWMLLAWTITCVLLSGVGMYDFYKWEYDYGHNLDPTAAIKIPGMSYQPPMFGTKQMLNFRTTAWPGPGGVGAMAAVGLACFSTLITVFPSQWNRLQPRRRKRTKRATPENAQAKYECAVALPVLFSLFLCVAGCSRGPQPIAYNEDQCSYCMMTITNDGYGTEVMTSKGRAYKYDSVECMASAIVNEDDFSGKDAAHIYVTDFGNRGHFIDATSAVYLHSKNLPSPMGGNLTAFADAPSAEAVQRERDGEFMDWNRVLERYAADAAGGVSGDTQR